MLQGLFAAQCSMVESVKFRYRRYSPDERIRKQMCCHIENIFAPRYRVFGLLLFDVQLPHKQAAAKAAASFVSGLSVFPKELEET